MWIFVSDIGIVGLLTLAFVLGFVAGFWTAIGSVSLFVRGILYMVSDRKPFTYEKD
jgi:hypothetical protein